MQPKPYNPAPHPVRDLKFLTCVFVLLLMLASGVIGYRALENWSWLDSLYMTVITVSTVGFQEVQDLSEAGRIHTIILIFAGVSTLAVTLSIMWEKIFQHQFKLIMEKRGMHKKIDTLKQHTIVCGYGRMGRMIAANLQRQGEPLVVVESDYNRVDEIEQSGGLVQKGDATAEAT